MDSCCYVDMRIVASKILPFKGFLAVNLFGILFIRNEYLEGFRAEDMNHEYIHTEQMKELLYVGFYILYVLEWIYRLVFHTKTAYRGISFEREAYGHQDDLDYLKTRKHFAQWCKTN